jgi:hypothetical protein
MNSLGPAIAIVVVAVLVLLVLTLVVGAATGRKTPPPTWLPTLPAAGGGPRSCPECGSLSFQLADQRRGLFAFALGPLVFGSLAKPDGSVIACVACGTQFLRGKASS